MLLNVMKLLDVHAHLDSVRFEKDLDEVIEKFEKAGGKFIISSGVNPITNRKVLEIAEKYNIVKVSFGIYPIDAAIWELKDSEKTELPREIEKFDVDKELIWIEKHKNDCVAVGEIGLDYNWEVFKTNKMKRKQKEVFRKVLNLAKRIEKPVVIHSRKAELDAIEILEEMKMNKVVMHCFSGKKSLVRRCVDNGWSFSVPPVIVRLEHFKMLVEEVPLGQLLTETDSPYLSPVVGERNEPINILKTIKIIAEIKGLSEKEVAGQIFNNAKRLFKL